MGKWGNPEGKRGDFTTDLGNEGNPEGMGRRECFTIFAVNGYIIRKNRETLPVK